MMPAKKKRYCSGSVDCKKGSSSMSEKQKSLMIDFLTDNPSMVRDRSVGGTSNRDDRDELWEKLASMLNSCGAGAQKDGGGWRRSWQDLKRYESLKAKESMARLDKLTKQIREPPKLVLSPLQERIAHLLDISIWDAAEFIEAHPRHENQEKTNQPTDATYKPGKMEFQIKDTLLNGFANVAEKTFQGNVDTIKELNMAQALQNIANALTERNRIEERKLKVFENLLSVYAAKSGLDVSDLVNLGSLITN